MTLNYQKLIEQDAPSRTAYAKRYDYDAATGNLLYEGWALSRANAATSDPIWAVRSYTYSTVAGNSVVTLSQWASCGAPVNVWDSRTTLAYQ